MKRGATVQLTREHYEDEEMEDVNPPQGFQKADESILSSRPIKGLPKRGNTVAATFDAAESQNKSDTSSVPTAFFTFNAPAPATTSSPQPPSSNPSFTFSSPLVSPSATSAAKRLSSFINSASQLNGAQAAAPGARSATVAAEAAEARYFSSLRGLNEAIKAEIGTRLDSDPFADLAGMLEEYTEFRSNVQKEYDESQKPQGTSLTNGTTSTSPFSVKPSIGTPQTSSKPSLPVPPKSFAGFGAPSSSSASSTSMPLGGGFRPNFGAASSTSTSLSPFSLGSPSTGDKTPSTSSPFAAPSASSSAEKPSPFGVSGVSTKQSAFGDSSSGPFTLGSQTSNKSSGSGSVFGGASSSTASDPPANSRTTPSNFFGSGGVNNFTSAPSFGGAGSSSSGLSFGATKPSTGSLGNPVGFSFGSNPSTPGEKAFKDTAASSSGSFFPLVAPKTAGGFGSSSSVPSTSPFGNSAASTAANQDAAGSSAKTSTPASVASGVETRSNTPFSTDGGETPAQESSTPKELGENPNDLEGEGEEDEQTVYTSRVKVYRFGKKGDQPHWAEVGVGMVRIKKHKGTDSLRLLSRNSANGKIMLNFKLYSGFKVTRAKQVLNFVGHEDGVNVTFRVRVKDEAGAVALQEAIEKAVSSL